jgi:hypothetical protein
MVRRLTVFVVVALVVAATAAFGLWFVPSGIPPYAPVAVVVTLLLAALQTLAGAWLARALTTRSGRRA